MRQLYFTLLAALLLLASCTNTETRLSFRRYLYESSVTDSIVLQLAGLPKSTQDSAAPLYYTGYDLEFPVKALNDDVLRRLQLNLLTLLREGADLSASDPIAEMNRLFAGLTLTLSDTCPIDPLMIDDSRLNITSHELTVLRTITNTDSLYTVCLSDDSYAFGAAHGSYSLRYFSFSTLTGNQLTFDSLFIPGSDTVFCNFMTRQIPLDYMNSYNQEFSFQGDPLVDNGSFYFSPDGVIFSFSPYSIGSYADGQIDCLIPSSIAKPLLQPAWSHLIK